MPHKIEILVNNMLFESSTSGIGKPMVYGVKPSLSLAFVQSMSEEWFLHFLNRMYWSDIC